MKKLKIPSSIFLIDYENVGEKGLLKLLTKLQKVEFNAYIVVFYSKNAAIKIDTINNIKKQVNKIKFIKVCVGRKDALDFQLVSYLGYLIGRHRNLKYYIVSNDKGFDSVIPFWGHNTIKRLGINTSASKTNETLLEQSKKTSNEPPTTTKANKVPFERSEKENRVPLECNDKENRVPLERSDKEDKGKESLECVNKESSCELKKAELKKYLKDKTQVSIVLKFFNRCKKRKAIYNCLDSHFAKDKQKAKEIYKEIEPLFDKYGK